MISVVAEENARFANFPLAKPTARSDLHVVSERNADSNSQPTDQMKLTNPKNGEEITTTFTSDTDAAQALGLLLAAGTVTASDFATSMWEAGRRDKCSPSQRFWLHKLAMQEPPKASGSFNLAGLKALFDKAAAKLKRPAIILDLPVKSGERKVASGVEIKVSVAGSGSRYPGHVMVASPDFGGAFYGRVAPTGDYFAGRDDKPEVRALLSDLAADAAACAADHGRMTGKCCFCNRKLDTEESTSVGYGPVCAERFGLPWGKKLAAKNA